LAQILNNPINKGKKIFLKISLYNENIFPAYFQGLSLSAGNKKKGGFFNYLTQASLGN
jgi:hypothetical protein